MGVSVRLTDTEYALIKSMMDSGWRVRLDDDGVRVMDPDGFHSGWFYTNEKVRKMIKTRRKGNEPERE